MDLKKKLGIAALATGLALSLGACGGGASSDKKSGDSDKTITISVDAGYKKFINEIKGDFEKDNNAKVKIVEKDMFEQLEALPLDGPAGTAPDVMMSSYDRIGGLGQQGHLAEVKLGNKDNYDEKGR